MNIDLISVIDTEGLVLPFNAELETTDDGLTALSKVSGKVSNFSGRLELDADVTSVVTTVCAVTPVTTRLKFVINEIIDGEEIALDGTVLNVREVTEKHLFLNLPMKFLCRDDCKGLCANCGADLNAEECKCGGGEIDERFSALKKLLDS
ncbi:MAG: hypothetical protein BWY15_00390 [Firmicutes bacterium ADurb.Bin193]|nr:MAG: hypothetical protein BWY15_00390 [Firmicutes bacterium ADurb.Bin193]